MRTDKELKQLAVDMLADKIFTNAHIREGDEKLLGSIFMPIMLIDQKQRDILEAKDVNVLFEYYSESRSSINGYPVFMTMKYMNNDEWKVVTEYYEKLKAAINEV